MWTVTVDFAVIFNGDDWGDAEDVDISRSFEDEAEAKAFWSDALEACADWIDDERGVRPGTKAHDFPLKYNLVVFDPEGRPCGGYIKGLPVGEMVLAPTMVLRAVYVQDVQEEWLATMKTDGRVLDPSDAS